MNQLSDIEWELINKIILNIYVEDNSREMRKTFLENLRSLIPFDIAEFSNLIQCNLTEREIQILKLLLTDMTNYSIANDLYISMNTLKKHNSNIFKKLDVKTRSQLKNRFIYNSRRKFQLQLVKVGKIAENTRF